MRRLTDWWWDHYNRLDDFGRFLLVVTTFAGIPVLLIILLIAATGVFHA